MANWVLVPCGRRLQQDLDRIAPNRRKPDGTIGDKAHQQHVSDHNDDEVGKVPIRDADSKHEVHALDPYAELNEPNLTMEMVVQYILGRCRSGAEERLRYIIYNRRIWEASNGWRQRAYTGDSPHIEHAHFSFSYETKLEADTSSWKLELIPVALTAADKNSIAQMIDARADALEAAILKAIGAVPANMLKEKIGDETHPGRSVGDNERDFAQLRGFLVAAPEAITPGDKGGISPTAPVVQVAEAARVTLSE